MHTPVQLERKHEFEIALENYQISDHAKSILDQVELVILLGVFAGGRNAIIDKLIQTGRYYFIISDTTRPPKVRNGTLEQDGQQYYFRTEQSILDDIKKGEYLEAEIIHNQQVSGISIRELEKAKQSGKIAINEIDILGTVNILRVKPDTKMVFIVPPSYEEWVRRIRSRESMSDHEFDNRMTTAKRILAYVIENDIFEFVINDNLEEAASQVDQYATTNTRLDHGRDKAISIITDILDNINRSHTR